MKEIGKSNNMQQYYIDISGYKKTEQNMLRKYIGYTGFHAEIIERKKSKITKSTIHIEGGIPKKVRKEIKEKYNNSKHIVEMKEVSNCLEICFGQINKPFKSLNDKEKKNLNYERKIHPDYKTIVNIVCKALLEFEYSQNKTSLKTNNKKTNNKKSNNKKSKQKKEVISLVIPYEAPNVTRLKKNFNNKIDKLRDEVKSLEIELNVKMRSEDKNNREYDDKYEYYYKQARKEYKNFKSYTTKTPKKWFVFLSRYEYLTKLKEYRNSIEEAHIVYSSEEHKNENKTLKTNGVGSDHVEAAHANGSI